jgi:hypothetical protein
MHALPIEHSDTLAKLMNNIGKLETKTFIDIRIMYRSRDGLRRPLLLDLVEFALHLINGESYRIIRMKQTCPDPW